MEWIKAFGAFLIYVGIIFIFCLPYLIYLKKQNLLTIWDKLIPGSALIFWFIFVEVVLKGSISMTNALLDIIIISFTTLFLLYGRLIFIKFGKLKDDRVSVGIFLITMFLAVGLRMFTPVLRD